MLSEQLEKKLDFYEKFYFALDEPVPFKNDILVYPVLVKDYYKFYSYFTCLTMDKNTKKQKYMDFDPISKQEVEKIRDVSNPKGLSMSYMAYLIDMMEDKDFGQGITAYVTSLLELVLHEKNGLYCPDCWEKRMILDKDNNKERMYGSDKSKDVIPFEEISKNLKQLDDKEQIVYFTEQSICPYCGKRKREVFSIKDTGVTKRLCIYNTELTSQDFEELKAIIMHYNILDYDGDKYIDPDLKADLEKKKKLQNKDYTSPTLERQLVCVSISTPYTTEELKNVSLRKLAYMLKMVDKKQNYYAQVQGQYSGMVKFKEDPKHWIFSDDGRDINKEITMVDDFKRRFDGF